MKKRVIGLILSLLLMLIGILAVVSSNPGIFSPVFELLVTAGIYPDSLEPVENAAALYQERMQNRIQEVDQYQEAAITLRDAMMQRKSSITVEFRLEEGDDLVAITNAIYEAAFTYDPSLPAAGDYLRQHVRSILYDETLYENNWAKITYTMTANLSTAEQEQYINRIVPEILSSLFPEDEDYTAEEQIDLIYRFVRDNLEYSTSTELTAGSAYSGLSVQETTCNGYAALLYRLLLEAGIKCRIITGYYQGAYHAWNLILMPEGWRNVDATLDDQLPELLKGIEFREYYLLHSTTFFGHERDYRFLTETFLKGYPE